MSSVLTPPDRTLPPSVISHCEPLGLLEHLRVALRLAEQVFEPVQRISATVEVDPETDESAVVIDVSAALNPDEAAARKRAYAQQWVAAVPPEVIGKIRLVLDIG